MEPTDTLRRMRRDAVGILTKDMYDAICEAIALIEKLEADAQRWRTIKDHHLTTRAMTRKGEHLWSFKPIWRATGETPEEVIDNEAAMFAICEENNPNGTSCKGCLLKKPKCGGIKGKP